MSTNAHLLANIRERPGLYLGKPSLTALHYLMDGYSWALGHHGIKDDHVFKLPEDFHDWVAYRLHYKGSTSGWCNMLLGACEDEARAFGRFFELLDEHAVRKPHVFAKLIGCQNTYQSGLGEQATIHPYPQSISLLTYTDDPGFFAVSDDPAQRLPMLSFYPCFGWFDTFVTDRARLTILDANTFARLSAEDAVAKAEEDE